MLESLATLYSMLHGNTEDVFGLEIWKMGPQDQAQVQKGTPRACQQLS